ncbi:unnamed protein product [Anisakis simplex]|uniref:Breast cancer type 1 susceptibility protein homolog n=1 Tax=Anisakis simplex TaxID=6269 RepID=A0A0M3J3P5_ANISI|nr:unnamed protein product [Anisakis simplex]VDK19557.1 unnamed protein product [Anisakis simplex]
MNGIRGSPTMGPSRRISPKFSANVCRPNAVDSNKFSISLKPHSSGYVPKGQHRLSVPDLAELAYGKMGATNAMMAHGGVASSAKALTSKLGRSPGTGELQAITEGLVTPVVRRKQYLREIPVQVTTSPNQPVSPSQSAKRSFIPCERSGKNVNQITKDSGVGTTVLNEHGFTKRLVK